MESYFLSSISADAAGAIDSGNVQETVAVDQTSNVGSHDDAQGQDVQPALEQVAGGASGFSTPPVDPRTDILGDEAQGQDVDVVDADQSGEPASEQVTSGASGFSTPPINPRMNLLDDEIVFKTPNVAATPGSRARGEFLYLIHFKLSTFLRHFHYVKYMQLVLYNTNFSLSPPPKKNPSIPFVCLSIFFKIYRT